jgi:rSAM/selenodomain-associated transferase 1
MAVMARRPGSGAAKTRLAERLDEDERARLYEAFLTDKLAQVSAVAGVRLVVAVAPPDDASTIARWCPDGATVIVQRGAELGARLEALAADLFAAGARAVVLLDSDTPTLPLTFLEEAMTALASDAVDVVFGPAWDGGYYLVGMRRPRPELFRGIPWSTPAVLRESLAAADRAGLRVHLLQSWYDVDRPSDLDRLASQLARLSPFSPGYPRATARFVASALRPELETPRNEHWHTRSSREVYANPWLSISERIVTLPSGHVTLYGVVRTSPCVGVLAFVSERDVLLVRQFRYVARRFTWEIPTGGVHPGESLEDAARRELREEAGVDAERLVPLLSFDTSKSVVEETAHLFAARASQAGALGAADREGLDETEDIERRVFSLEDARRMVQTGAITDSMSVVALLATTGCPA